MNSMNNNNYIIKYNLNKYKLYKKLILFIFILF